ncbi:hypothetical protein [Aeromonas caviae]|uniref:hypothetical protein n=1 Tax=Aeromonas caviae TaxID=648 RepID=UPI002B460A8B|nr:hypothetical protein [Aeromonas caviae]
MVRYTGPPADRQRGASPPQGIYQTNTGRRPATKSQDCENKKVIGMIKAVFAANDQSDEGAVPLIDITKVTRSTLADKPLTQPRDGAVQRSLQPGSAAINHTSGGTKSGEKTMAKAKNGQCSTQKQFGAAANCFVLLSSLQVLIKSNRTKTGRLLTNLLS